MAVTELETGSQTSVITTEHTLNTTTPETTDGMLMLFLDVSAMASGDLLEIRCKEKARSGDTQREIYVETLVGVQASPMWVGPALIMLHGWDFSIKQTTGSARAYPWSIRAV